MCGRLRKFLVVLLAVAFLQLPGTSGMQGSFYDNRICTTFFSEVNFGGNSFVLRDEDQSLNTRKDYRSLLDGWVNTRSIRVEENCTLNACSDTYFEGNCKSYPSGDRTDISQLSSIQSASCTCSKECKCADMMILKNDDICGRAYVNGDCNECDSQYVQLWEQGNWWNFPEEYADSVRAIALRSGCLLIVYNEDFRNGDSRQLTGPIVQNFQGTLLSYECRCLNDEYNSPLRYVSVPRLQLPSSSDQLLETIFSNATMAEHPGILAAKKSLLSGRSHRNVYILMIGLDQPEDAGFFQSCGMCVQKICECHVALDVPELGISQAQLRVIQAFDDPEYGTVAQWVASLDQYLASHEDLKDSIPNAVILYHNEMYDSTIAEENSKLQRKVAVVNALRGRVLDENYSNLVFMVLDWASSVHPKAKIPEFEAAIRNNWNFPRPTVLLPAYQWNDDGPKVNGHWRMNSGEYYFQNVYRALLLESEKCGDAFGHAIFKAAFPADETEWSLVRRSEMDLLPPTDTRVKVYQQLVSNPASFEAFPTHAAMNRAHKLLVLQENIRTAN